MNSFDFYSPTYFAFGREKETDCGTYIRRFGGHRVLVVYGSRIAKDTALLEKIHRIGRTGRAKRHGVAYTLLSDFPSRMRLSDIERNTRSRSSTAGMNRQIHTVCTGTFHAFKNIFVWAFAIHPRIQKRMNMGIHPCCAAEVEFLCDAAGRSRNFPK